MPVTTTKPCFNTGGASACTSVFSFLRPVAALPSALLDERFVSRFGDAGMTEEEVLKVIRKEDQGGGSAVLNEKMARNAGLR
jgi:hypothetical protein